MLFAKNLTDLTSTASKTHALIRLYFATLRVDL